MPNYKKELKKALYGDTLEGQEKVNYENYLHLLNNRTLEQYFTDTDKQIQEKTNLHDTKVSEYRTAQEYKERQLSDGIEKDSKKKLDKIFDIESENYRTIAAAKMATENIVMLENDWADKYGINNEKGIDEVAAEIDTEINEAEEKGMELSFSNTNKFISLDLEHQLKIAGYIDSVKMMKEYKESLPENEAKFIENGLAEYRNEVTTIRKRLDEVIAEAPSQEEISTIKTEIDDLKTTKENTKNYDTELSKKADGLIIDDLKNATQKKGLDMLTKARAEYRNNCNLWERIWANVLPSSLYGPSKYVEKINEYKSALSEIGFTDKQIENADPAKDKDYVKSKTNGKYFKVGNLSNKKDATAKQDLFIKENTVKDYDLDSKSFTNDKIVPTNGTVSKDTQDDFHKALGEDTGNNTTVKKTEQIQNTNNQRQLNDFSKK